MLAELWTHLWKLLKHAMLASRFKPTNHVGMKANPLACAFLLLLAVAVQLPAQQSATNAAPHKNVFDDIPSETNQAEAQRQEVARAEIENKLVAERTTALNDWERKVKSRDPDYLRLQKLVVNRAVRMADDKQTNGKKLLSASEMVAVLQESYESVKAGLTNEVSQSAERGDPHAQFELGWVYANGIGVGTNTSEAAKWYRKAAEQGLADAQFNLGHLMFLTGQGMKQKGDGSLTVDIIGAESWFRKAAEQGHGDAQTELGLIKLFFRKDYADAEKWLRKGAAQNHAGAEYLLGSMFAMGWGVEKDYVEAVKWTQKGAEQGHIEAQKDLGTMYFTGQGVEQDYVEAYAWWNLAAKTDTNAADKRAILEKRITPAQVAEAQKRTKELRALVGARSKGEPGSDNSSPGFHEFSPRASGTGFFITEDGFLITNAHVVEDAVQVRLVTSAGFLAAKVVKVDAANDLALLKAEGFPRGGTPLPVAPSRGVKLGGTVATVGFPNVGLQGFAPKFARGEIAALSGARDDARYFQISVPVQPGNSGGALVNEFGNVVGVVSAKLSALVALKTSGALPENVNYAVKSSYLLGFLESVPDVAAKLKEVNSKERKFDEVVKDAEKAAVLVLVY